MISANEARLLTSKGRQEFYDRVDIQGILQRIEKDIKISAAKGLGSISYIEDAAALFNDFALIRDRLEGIGFNVRHFAINRKIQKVTITWDSDAATPEQI